jgi:hypothetical protein
MIDESAVIRELKGATDKNSADISSVKGEVTEVKNTVHALKGTSESMNGKLDLLLGRMANGHMGNAVKRTKVEDGITGEIVPEDSPFHGPFSAFKDEDITKFFGEHYSFNKAARIDKFGVEESCRILKTLGVGEARVIPDRGAVPESGIEAEFLFTKLSRTKSPQQWRDKFKSLGVPNEAVSSQKEVGDIGYAFWFLLEPSSGEFVEAD